MSRAGWLRQLRYELRLYARLDLVAAYTGAMAIPFMLWLPRDVPALATQLSLVGLETYACLFAPLLMGALASREFEGRTADLVCSRPGWQRAVLMRTGIGAAAVAGMCLLAILAYVLRGAAVPLSLALWLALPGALFLGAMAAAVGAITRMSAAAYLVPVSYWLVDLATKGRYTGLLTLGAWGRGSGAVSLPAAKGGLLAAALAAAIAASVVVQRRWQA